MQILKETEIKGTVGGGVGASLEDLSEFVGKPFRDFLSSKGQCRVNVKYETKDFYGNNGISGMATDVNWSLADRVVKSAVAVTPRYTKERPNFFDYDIELD